MTLAAPSDLIRDAATGEEPAEQEAPRAGLLALALSPDGERVAPTGWDPHLRLWELVGSRQRAAHHANSFGRGLAFDRVGNRMLVAFEGALLNWDVTEAGPDDDSQFLRTLAEAKPSGQLLRYRLGGPSHGLAFSPGR